MILFSRMSFSRAVVATNYFVLLERMTQRWHYDPRQSVAGPVASGSARTHPQRIIGRPVRLNAGRSRRNFLVRRRRERDLQNHRVYERKRQRSHRRQSSKAGRKSYSDPPVLPQVSRPGLPLQAVDLKEVILRKWDKQSRLSRAGLRRDLEFHQLDLRYEGLRVRRPERERRLLASLAERGQQVPIVVIALAGEANQLLFLYSHLSLTHLEFLPALYIKLKGSRCLTIIGTEENRLKN